MDTTLTGTALSELARDWESFYLLIGTAGATLAGLLFVATSLAPRLVTPGSVGNARAFTDPPLLAFVSSLVLGGLLLIPTLRAGVLGVLLLLAGLLASLYSAAIIRRLQASQERDFFRAPGWLWYAVLPTLGNALIFLAGAAFVLGRAVLGKGVLAGATLLLLATGVRNAWDLMVWLVSHGGEG